MSNQTNPESGFPSDVLVDLRPDHGRGLRAGLEHGLRSAIQQRRLVPGTALPPTRVLAGELGVSRSVVVDAYANLRADGYLEARQGSGTRVRLDPQARAQREGRPAGDDLGLIELTRRSFAPRAPIMLLGGLPDPALFDRALWLRHYRGALAALPDHELGYPDVLGAGALRAALTAYLGRVRGVATAPEQLLVCGGVTQGLTLVCRALRRAGARRMAVEDPCFGVHRSAIAQTGLEPVPVAVDADGLDPAGLASQDVDAVLVAPAHGYPKGGTLDAGRRHELVAWARRHGRLIVEDDYDAEFRYDRVPVGALQGLAPDRVVYLGSASKTVTPALRLGWVAAPADLIDAVLREKLFDDMGSSLLEQLAFARFIDHGDLARFLRRVRPVYRARRDAALSAVDELLPESRVHGAAAGLHLYVALPADVDEPALRRAAYRRGVVLERAAWHWARPEQAPPALVLGYGSRSEALTRRAIELLAACLPGTRRRREAVTAQR